MAQINIGVGVQPTAAQEEKHDMRTMLKQRYVAALAKVRKPAYDALGTSAEKGEAVREMTEVNALIHKYIADQLGL